MTDSDATVLLEIDGHVATLSLNRPPRNTMKPDLMSCFMERIAEVRETPAIRALVVTSVAGHFCAGAELGEGMPGSPKTGGGPPGLAGRLRGVYAPFLALVDVPVPTVAAVRKAAVGGGLGLAAACDFRVVTPKSRLMAPFVKLGLHPGMALTHLLPQLIGLPRAMEMLMTGEEVRGERALEWGLANRCVAEEDLQSEARAFADRLAAGAPAVTRWTKRAIHRAVELDPRAAADIESLAQALTLMSDDAREGMTAFFQKRTPDFQDK